ncbi:MAG: thiamine biosynthesis protein ThiS [Actinobacteria bacterium 21-73-9]|nr:MAG: thiamine biosynthesis protein ThiS [Actinobacteria bacterium 21-73-9]
MRVNGEDRPWPGGTVADLVASLDLSPRGIAVALDGTVVARSLWSSTRVVEGAIVEVVTAAAGG